MTRQHLVIVGAGIIGSHCAIQLRERLPDAKITVVDRDPFSYDGASSGNMGGFATSEVQPMATVGNILHAFSWMLNPLAPFTLHPRSLPSLRPWILRFVRAAFTPGHYQHVIDAQELLMSRSHAAHLNVIANTPLADLISPEGALVVYKNERRLKADWNRRWRLFRERGETCELLGDGELHDRLPGLDRAIKCGIHVPNIRHWTSSAGLLRGLHEMLRERDVTFQSAEAVSVEGDSGQLNRLLLANSEPIEFDMLVIAAGAWSKSLCRDVGDNVPLDSERGYSTTIQDSGVILQNLLLFPDDEFVATPMSDRLRLGGTVELASLDVPPNFVRTDILATRIKDYFPDIDTSHRDEWMGHRPSMPDGLPVISASPSAKNVYYAFGHGHVGMTQSAITGVLLAQIATGAKPEVDITPFSIERFA